MRLFTIIRKVSQAAATGSNFIVRHRAGLRATLRATGTVKADQRAGFTAAPRLTGLVREAIGLAASIVTSGTVRVAQRAGMRASAIAQLIAARTSAGMSARVAPITATVREAIGLVVGESVTGTVTAQAAGGMTAAGRASGPANQMQAAGGAKVTRIRYGLVRRVGGDSVTEDAVGGRTDWANDANATGKHNGSSATIAGNLTQARNGQLRLGFPNSVSKTDLTILDVKLHFYWQVTFAAADVGTTAILKYDVGAGNVTLRTLQRPGASSENHLATPETFDVPITTWAQVDALQTMLSMQIPLANTGTNASLDAVEVEITALAIDTF